MNRKYCECKLTSSRASASSITFNKNLIEVLSAENRTWHSGATRQCQTEGARHARAASSPSDVEAFLLQLALASFPSNIQYMTLNFLQFYVIIFNMAEVGVGPRQVLHIERISQVTQVALPKETSLLVNPQAAIQCSKSYLCGSQVSKFKKGEKNNWIHMSSHFIN